MTRVPMLAAAALLVAALPAMAQTCDDNFIVEGTPLVTALNFRTSQNFNGLDPNRALNNLSAAVMAEGFLDVETDRKTRAITARQETSGSGRPQALRIVARKVGNATRVDAVFMVQAGQVADPGMVRTAICRVVSSARN